MSARCRVMFTRVCPRSLPAECPDVCLRFEVEEPPPVEVVVIWWEHWEITDRLGRRST